MKKYFLLFGIFICCSKIYSIESDFMLRANFIHKWLIDRPPITSYGLGYSAKIAHRFQVDLSVYFFNENWHWEGAMGFPGTPDTNIYHGTANGTLKFFVPELCLSYIFYRADRFSINSGIGAQFFYRYIYSDSYELSNGTKGSHEDDALSKYDHDAIFFVNGEYKIMKHLIAKLQPYSSVTDGFESWGVTTTIGYRF